MLRRDPERWEETWNVGMRPTDSEFFSLNLESLEVEQTLIRGNQDRLTSSGETAELTIHK